MEKPELAKTRKYPVHDEPYCQGVKGCNYAEPHRHGFPCDKTCIECFRGCHPKCPAYNETKAAEITELYSEAEDRMVNHPPHYVNGPVHAVCGQPIECIDVIEDMALNLGNAVKYVWRVDLKDTDIENLKKASWYINREIQRRERRKT